jgi:uncharacterized membrane protein YkvA (DUF1232 family)
MFDLLRQAMWCFSLLVAVFLVLLALPQSKLRDVCMPIVGWGLTALSVLYIVSPLDFLPDVIPVLGWGDDAAAAILGIVSACSAIEAQKRNR